MQHEALALSCLYKILMKRLNWGVFAVQTQALYSTFSSSDAGQSRLLLE